MLGIDLGTEYIKAALVKPGIPLEIVLTKDSKRKEAATLAFKPSQSQTTDEESMSERLYGGDANALAGRFPGDVYLNLKTLLGVDVDSDVAKEYEGRYPGLNMEIMVRNETSKQGTVAFKSQAFDKKEPPFMVEELLAMELKNIRANAEAVAGRGAEITDVVLTFPAFYTAEEKRALELAADLAGMKVLGLISDGLAVGLNYATSRTFPSITEGATPEFHLVYDMGAGSTTATVLRFQGRTVKDVGRRNKTIQEVQVMGTNWKKGLGGDAWNQLIVEDMIAKFADTPKMKALDVSPVLVRKNAKTVARLWKEAEHMRQVLSANSQTSATLEGLFLEDMNFKYKLSRAEFEELALIQASHVSVPLVHALDAAGISMQELTSIILHGGAVRTPFVQKHLEAVAGGSGKIRTNVNADEAAVLGAAFKAAGLSPSFRVKDVRADDTPAFDIRLRWTTDGKERTQRLFTQRSLIGAEKQVPFKLQEDFTFELSQIVDEKDEAILEVKVSNLTASVAQLKDKYGCAPSNISTKFAMRLSPLDGLPDVVSGTVSCEIEGAKEGGVMDNVKGLFGFGSKKNEDQQVLKDDDSSEADITTSVIPTSAVTSSSSATTSTIAKPTNPSPTTITIPLSFTTRPLGLNLPLPPSQLSRIRTRVALLDTSDLSRAHRAEALNTLESFTYRARDHLSDPSFLSHSPPNTLSTLDQQLSETSDWLYGDGTDAPISAFQSRLKVLKELVDPVLKRREEATKRPAAIDRLTEALEQIKGVMKMVETSIEKAAEEEADARRNAEAAEKAEKSASSQPSASATTPADPEPEADLDEDLDQDPYSSSSSSTTTTTTSSQPNPKPTPDFSLTDLTTLQTTHSTLTQWLTDTLAAQAQRTPHEDPVFLVRELEEKSRDVQDLLGKMLVRGLKGGEGKGKGRGNWKAGKSAKVKVPKRTGTATATATADTATATAAGKGAKGKAEAMKGEEDGNGSEKAGASATASRRDEL